MQYICFTEANDNEGESWRFWLQYDGNEKAIDNLKVLLNTFDEDYISESYQFSTFTVPESDVDVLVKYTEQGYFEYENKVSGKMKQVDVEDSDELNGLLYKGGITRLFK
jgi:hypothetical protein